MNLFFVYNNHDTKVPVDYMREVTIIAPILTKLKEHPNHSQLIEVEVDYRFPYNDGFKGRRWKIKWDIKVNNANEPDLIVKNLSGRFEQCELTINSISFDQPIKVKPVVV